MNVLEGLSNDWFRRPCRQLQESVPRPLAFSDRSQHVTIRADLRNGVRL